MECGETEGRCTGGREGERPLSLFWPLVCILSSHALPVCFAAIGRREGGREGRVASFEGRRRVV